jgi:hypothetical protein
VEPEAFGGLAAEATDSTLGAATEASTCAGEKPVCWLPWTPDHNLGFMSSTQR